MNYIEITALVVGVAVLLFALVDFSHPDFRRVKRLFRF